MRSGLDDLDLYPPDADDTEITSEARQHRMRVAAGTTLLVWGTSLIVQRILRVDLDTFALGLGLGALAAWVQVRRYPWFVGGAIFTGLGAAEVAGAFFDGAFGSMVASLLVAVGFAAVYVRYPRRATWALFPAGAMLLIAAAAFGVGLIGLLPSLLGRFLLPLLLVSGGSLLVFRNSLPSKTWKIGLAGLAAVFVLVGVSTVPSGDQTVNLRGRGTPVGGPPQLYPSTLELPPLEGRTLVIDGDAGNVEFRVGTNPQITQVGTRPLNDELTFEEDGDRVIIRPARQARFDGAGEGDLVVQLPKGVDVDVRRGSGSITGTIAGGRGSFRTESGDVELRLEDGGGEGPAGDGPYEIDTDSGSISVESNLVLDLDLDSDGSIDVDGQRSEGRFTSPTGTRGVEVEVDSDSGGITIDMPGHPDAPTVPEPPTAPVPPS